MHPQHQFARRKGVVTIMVIWAIAIASIIVAATQILSFREATIGANVFRACKRVGPRAPALKP